nr:MAG TPA: hypothetical protein [Bacteriophage sp.]
MVVISICFSVQFIYYPVIDRFNGREKAMRTFISFNISLFVLFFFCSKIFSCLCFICYI